MANIETPSQDIINTVIDPVCGTEVYPVGIRRIAIYCGRAYWFCSLECRTAFEMNPPKYLDAKPEKPEGLLRRSIRWMAGSN
jgi:YHS domain-containing protein